MLACTQQNFKFYLLVCNHGGEKCAIKKAEKNTGEISYSCIVYHWNL